ncbi:unnamed protein product [Paramecium sonneborni]|uniref:RING-type E3 ubiquitin transferase n=1 Tax=Paramecium sonneborni TaxID=65129 RepID=A0A8S1P3U2_9CILI|nr:unnamed protein product [Paramecium sonneborni]
MQSIFSVLFITTILVVGKCLNQVSEKEMIKFLIDQKFIGTWQSRINSMDQFHYLDYQEGQAEVTFDFNKNLQICFLNPKYHENKQVYATFRLSNYTNLTKSWSDEQNVNLQFGTIFNLYNYQFPCQGKFLVQVIQENTFSDIKNTQIIISLQSKNNDELNLCYFDMSLSVASGQEQEYRNTLTFMIISIVLSLIQIVATTILVKVDVIVGQDISFIANLLNFVYQNEITILILISMTMNENLRSFYIAPIIFQVGSTLQCIYATWKAWKINVKFSFLPSCQDFWHFISFILIIFLLINLSIYCYEEFFYFSIYGSAFMLYPIIIRNIKLNIRERFSLIYIFGHFSSKIFYFFYMRGCSRNLMSFEPKYLMVVLYLMIYLTSIVLLIIQKRYGSRSIICRDSRIVQPIEQIDDQIIFQEDVEEYLDDNYFKYDDIVIEDLEACSICLNPLKSNQNINDSLSNTLIEQKLIQTPCKHTFHLKCMKLYIQSRINILQNNCPICRQQLPQFK